MVKAHIYGTEATALIPFKVYNLHGRFISRNKNTPPIMYCKQDITLHIGTSSTYMSSLASKVAVNGTGIVIQREEVEGR
ncbi:hypothetical protein PGTUg99_015848 [Puccinia graminis f. sp. tritici]|uniref:Uncharacterized protein n=1 Tax=Puccinia graminis f. sp. tritici TaxID=56615 RepID=A0A5B0R6L0_PUCGR|nr:hypothetical protein PGTUg99_015848 [Puccinia graminis f. sp. tritici]